VSTYLTKHRKGRAEPNGGFNRELAFCIAKT
jgi:hypothetical protein